MAWCAASMTQTAISLRTSILSYPCLCLCHNALGNKLNTQLMHRDDRIHIPSKPSDSPIMSGCLQHWGLSDTGQGTR
ncbi:hypothetical protein BDW62DRAFT_173571 [Aspergillus aurantiobrunneus]